MGIFEYLCWMLGGAVTFFSVIGLGVARAIGNKGDWLYLLPGLILGILLLVIAKWTSKNDKKEE